VVVLLGDARRSNESTSRAEHGGLRQLEPPFDGRDAGYERCA
jgi:hypothetical protein